MEAITLFLFSLYSNYFVYISIDVHTLNIRIVMVGYIYTEKLNVLKKYTQIWS